MRINLRTVILLSFILVVVGSYGQTNDWDITTPGKIVYTAGNVGIGTSNATQTLTVDGDVNVGGEGNHILRVRHINGKSHTSSGYGDLYLNYHNTHPVIVGRSANKSNFYVYGTMRSYYDGTRYLTMNPNGDGNYYLNYAGGSSASRIGFQIDGSSKMSIMNNGNVGIGTTNPGNILEVQKNINESAFLEITNANDGNLSRRGISIGNGSSGSSVGLISTSPNYTAVATWQNAGVLYTDSQLLNGLILRSSTGGISFQPGGTTDKITFTDNGDVGIGTSSPSQKLDVNGSVSLSRLYIKNEFDQIRFEVAGESRYFLMSKTKTDNKALALYSPDDGGWFTYWEEVSGDMIVNKGSVGIGLTNPTERLDINGNIKVNRKVKIDGKGSVASLQIMDNSNTSTVDVLLRGDGGKSYIKSGELGIGTTNPSEKLEVNGTIRSKEVKVEASPWPDYVFEPDYELASLEEIEKFIQSEKHLPEIPSAEEIEANGVQLGEMNMLLLKKIEELTLHQIEMMKIINQQQQKIDQLNKK